MAAPKKVITWPSPLVAKRAATWLVFLGPFFYLSYGLANYLASLRDNVSNITFAWEHAVPFLAWTIIPYWSINLFYVTTLFGNATPTDVDRVAQRYLTCQIIAVTCFVLFPLRAIFEKPESAGLTGFMFDALASFDKPFNQAPSLHIALLVIVWDHWRNLFRGAWLNIWHLWCALIGLSVLTTFQHHFIDIPTGALLGLFALWLFPDAEFAQAKILDARTPERRKIGLYYTVGASVFLLFAILGFRLSPLSLFWLWPSLSLTIVAAAYLGSGVCVFQKRSDGSVSLASYWLLMPYRWGARINIWIWTRKLAPSAQVLGNVHLGRFPKESEIKNFAAIIDMTGEMLAPQHENLDWKSFPVLDLTPPSNQSLNDAAQAIQMTQEKGRLLVCCALGFQRSAAALAVWLVRSGHAKNAADAIELIALTGRPVHLDPAMIEAVVTT